MRTHSLRRAMVVVLIGCVLVGGCTRSTLEDQVGPPSGGASSSTSVAPPGTGGSSTTGGSTPSSGPVDLGTRHQRARRQRRHAGSRRARGGAATRRRPRRRPRRRRDVSDRDAAPRSGCRRRLRRGGRGHRRGRHRGPHPRRFHRPGHPVVHAGQDGKRLGRPAGRTPSGRVPLRRPRRPDHGPGRHLQRQAAQPGAPGARLPDRRRRDPALQAGRGRDGGQPHLRRTLAHDEPAAPGGLLRHGADHPERHHDHPTGAGHADHRSVAAATAAAPPGRRRRRGPSRSGCC